MKKTYLDRLKAILRKIKKKHIIFFEVIIMVLLMIVFVVKKQGTPQSLDTGLTATDFSSNYVSYDAGWHISPDLFVGENETIDMLFGPFFTLEKGDYSLVIAYKCDEKQSARPYAAGRNINYIQANTIELDPHLETIVYDFRIAGDIDDFEVRVYYDGKGNFDINDIRLYRNLNPLKRVIFLLVLFFLLVNICIFNYQKILKNKREIIHLLLIILLLSLPLFIEGIGYGLDTDFHLMRIEGISSELRRGIFPVRLQADWLFGNGYPSSIYYGDALLYLPAIMRLMGFTVTQAYKSYILFINILTVFISYCSFKVIIKDRNVAILMTLAFGTNAYRLMTMFFRDALGEYTATAFMPMVAAAVFLIYSDESDLKNVDLRNASILALGMSGIVLSHTLSTEMVTVVLFIFAILNINKTIRVRTLMTLVVAAVETILLSLYFLVPFIDYYINMDVASTHGVKDKILQIQDGGASLLELFLFYRDPFLGDWSLTPGAVLMTTLIFALVLLVASKTDRRTNKILIISLAVLFLSTNLFPWNWLAYHSRLWNALSVVEFQNRYIAVSGVLLTVLMGFLIKPFWENGSARLRLNLAAIIILFSVAGALVFYHFYDKDIITYPPLDTADVRPDVLLGANFTRVDENGEPIKTIRNEIEAKNAIVEVLSQKGTSTQMKVETGNASGIVKTPYFNYKGYRVADAEGNDYKIEDDEYCKVSFAVPANYEGIITVSFVEPWYWKAAEIISLIAWVGLIICFMFSRTLHHQYDSE